MKILRTKQQQRPPNNMARGCWDNSGECGKGNKENEQRQELQGGKLSRNLGQQCFESRTNNSCLAILNSQYKPDQT